ncbi:cyclic nucleotide-binding domain protein (macronuclear) [Tetrahymena thermophila SB210]|uniref:Cyclic nucleotide-binding domain protein n=1 Tax=Tetrahymena thermophila (strain SB210) TaxID=312017 RepID=Q23KM6_TETTS|nr:cyclic nucleotide-binding domain protein [Tetrahymena thermophila SB210]EAR97093.1 cyclic nucleotide-binding domain protein [Tetrahymena thermophila SB210]|eukprot:XP_001017338.1 cyclic nucleotide-binding domain protein [Tetrahymena thermophila SB210]
MDPQENYEFLNKRKSQMKKCLQKDSQLDVLNMRIEESCQSELDQIPTDVIPCKNIQTQQMSNTTSQYDEQNFTVFLNDNFNETKYKSHSTKFTHFKPNLLLNSSSKPMNQVDFQKVDNTKCKILNRNNQNDDDRVQDNYYLGNGKSKELVTLSNIKNKMKKYFREKTYVGKSFNLQNPKLRQQINDKSDIIEEQDNIFQQYCGFMDSLTELLYQKINNLPLFNPQSYLKFGLDIVFSLINCFFFFYSSILIVFQVNLEFESQIYNTMYLIWTLQIIFIVAHIIACLWFLVGYIELEYLGEEKTWFDESIAASDRNWVKLYICSLYWSLTLMTTGSNEADTVLQISFTSFIMLFTTIIFGYLLNIIGIVLTEFDQEEENQRRDINRINQYMRKRSISKNLQRGINLDLEYYYHHNFKKDDDQNQTVLSKISVNLLQELKKEYFGKFLNQIDVIYKNFSQDTQQKLLLYLEEQNYLPGQVINNYQNQDESRLIYIIEGKVEIVRSYSDGSDIEFVIDSFGKNKVIGQIAFFQGRQDGITIKAVDFTQVISIPRNKFLEIVKQNDLDLQNFCRIKDKISFYQDFEDIKIKCENCNSFNHQQYECTLLHIDKQTEKVIANYNYHLAQFRQNYSRKSKFQSNALITQQQTQNICKYICNECDFQEALVTSTQLKNSGSINEGLAVSEQEFDPLSNNMKTLRSHSQINYEEEENKPHSQDIIKKKGKGIIIKKNSQQIFLNLDTQVSNCLQDECDGSQKSIKDKLHKETSIVSKMLDGSTPQTAYHSQNTQLTFKNFLKEITQQCLKKLSRLENIIKVLPGQQIVLGKQQNQSSRSDIVQSVGTDKIIWEFDQKKDYTIYFPHGNSDKIIFTFNQKLKKNTLKSLKRKKK